GALLLGSQIREGELGYADLGDAECDRARDGPCHRQPDGAVESHLTLEIGQHGGERPAGDGPAIGEASDQDEATGDVVERGAERDYGPEEDYHRRGGGQP